MMDFIRDLLENAQHSPESIEARGSFDLLIYSSFATEQQNYKYKNVAI